MKATEYRLHSFVEYLCKLTDDRAALAALRRGLGQPPGYVPEMLRYISPFVTNQTSRWEERTLYMIASLFALHPAHTNEGNMGDHLARLKSKDDTALERRFAHLLSAHPDDLDVYLRQAVSILRSKEIPINWDQLLRDVRSWSHPDGQAQVRRRWARSFWSRGTTEVEDQSEENIRRDNHVY